MKSSVVMWDGIAGDVGSAETDSCTSRSKICEPAGDARRGDRCGDVDRTGDVGTLLGDAVVRLEGDCLGAEVLAAVAAGTSESSAFFLPKPNRERFFFLPSSGSLPAAGRGVLASLAELGKGTTVEGCEFV
ncbi:hypothetical protein MAPG_03991, partial [Magnaporthiopsis poae ATCC 64411]|uniref:Uncharacterized protein n=1 Tax=Magnaporthiopsis poae (strain ATCC 64411 / 73-15) TaxID=644358 RepID=A0A0C4DVI5_MAGP6